MKSVKCHHGKSDPTTKHGNTASRVSEHELIDSLRNPESYPHAPSKVELIQTHISCVAIASPRVYKVKKPVDLGFLDFSSLNKRKHFCHEEVRLNRRLCSDVYEGVVPISRTGRKLAVECDKNVVEVAVKMKLMQDGFFLNQLVDRNQASPQTLRRVAERLVSFYRSQQSHPEIAEWGRIDSLGISTEENFDQVEPFMGDVITAFALSVIREYTNTFFRINAPLLNSRRADGHILDCHGDLRLEHVHVTKKAVEIFDCIEFSERLRYIDTANDLAFLAMDLDYHKRPDLASFFVGCISRLLLDENILDLMDFYKCYRACVRGKVEGMRSRETEISASERRKSRERAVRFFQLALNYAVAGSEPVVLVIMGRIGSGKSTVSRILSEALGWHLESSDRMRKKSAAYGNEKGAGQIDQYSEEMKAQTYDNLIQSAVKRASMRHSTVLDATFGNKIRREKLRETLQAEGLRYCFIELTAPEAVLKERLGQRNETSSHASDARLENFDQINAIYEEPDALEDAHHLKIDASKPENATADEVLRHLAANKS